MSGGGHGNFKFAQRVNADDSDGLVEDSFDTHLWLSEGEQEEGS